MIILLKFIAVLGLVFFNGFFVASEFAIVKMRATRLSELADTGHIRASVAKKIVNNLDAYLSATQLGITISSLGLGWLGEPLISHQIAPFLEKAGITSETMITSISFVAGFSIITFLHIVFGELAPKSLAIQRTEGTTLWVSIPLRLFYWIFFPAIWVLNSAAIGVLRLVGVKPANEVELSHSEAELFMILSESVKGGHISEKEKEISEKALRLADWKARQVMVPRNEVVFFSLSDEIEQNLEKARANNFARYLLCEDAIDTVIGMVHIRDLLWMMHEQGEADLKSIALEVVVVSEESSLEDVLKKLRDTHIHMAVVTDEKGVLSGVVTLENVLEQLVGQIQDEFDNETPWCREIIEDVYDVSGRAPLTAVHARLGIKFGDLHAVTISGFLTEVIGRFPQKGDVVNVDNWRAEVTDTEALKVKTCRLTKI
jgi:magnesium and cobalt exporter, CNNM family